jgi:hypothetical protein
MNLSLSGPLLWSEKSQMGESMGTALLFLACRWVPLCHVVT